MPGAATAGPASQKKSLIATERDEAARTTWREDEHRHCEGPAIVVIPPPIVHTSEAVGHARHFLIDVFAPPRVDFSERPGWVLNADEYPLP